MDTHEARKAVVRFGVFEADLRSGELRKQGVRVKLQEQPFQILRILLERSGEVVTRDELRQRVWPADTFVDFDHGLNNAIRRLREALGDTADAPRFIETLPKRGYRFIGALNGNGTLHSTSNAPAANARKIWRLAHTPLIAMVIVVTLGILLLFKYRERVVVTSASNITQAVKSKAQEDFLAGRYHADQAYEAVVFKSGSMKKSDEEFAKGVSLLEQSIQEDPSYVPAYLELASSIMGEPPHIDLAPKARAALIKALSLDEANPNAHLLMASFLNWNLEGGWDNQEAHYKRAIQLGPNSVQAHEAYAEYLDDLGLFDAGMVEHQRAQALDPANDYLSSSPLLSRTEQLERRRKFMLTTSPSGVDYWKLGGLEFEAGQYSQTLNHWGASARIYGWNEEAAAWENAYANGGPQAMITEVVRVIDQTAKERYFPRFIVIDAYRYAGDHDGTLAWLATAYREHNDVIHHLRSDRRWDPYRLDPRFQAIARDVGLP